MSTVILSTIVWLWLISGVAFGANRDETPECNYPGDATCFTMLDENGDGVLDNTPATAAFVAVTGGYSANIKDCPKAGGFVNQADSTSISGTAVSKPTTVAYDRGEIACGFNVANGTYYSWLRVRNPTGEDASVWVKANFSNGLNFDNTNQTVIQVTNPYSWRQLNTLGTPRTFPLNGVGALNMKANALLVFDCWFLSTSATADPICQGETGASQPDYTILELGVAAAPTTWDHATWANAFTMQLNGTMTGLPCSGVGGITAKLLWANVATDRIYGTIACGSDADLIASTYSNDTGQLFGAPADKIDFRWRAPADLFQSFDANMRDVVGFPDNKFTDADWSGTNNSLNFATNLNTTVTGSIAAGVAWRVFFVANAGDITADSIGLCQLAVFDRDTGASSTDAVYFRGTTNTSAAQFGKCKWSSTTVGGGGPGTPVVVLAQPTSENIFPTSVQASATTTVPGNCKLHGGTSPGVYSLVSTGSPSQNGVCQETLTNLVAGTTYFIVMKVTNSVNVTGTSNEVNFSTPGSGATHFAGPTAQGNGTCIGSGNRGLVDVCINRSDFGPGKILELAGSTTSIPTIYTGRTGMIMPPANKNGTEAAPITVRCSTPGGCLIDAQQVAGSRPLWLANNDWWVVDGINFANSGLVGGSFTTVSISPDSSNNTIKRFVAWDKTPATTLMNNNNPGVQVYKGTNNTFEDCGFFGTAARKAISGFGANGHKVRRCWAVYNGANEPRPKDVFESAYNAFNAIYENNIGTWALVPACTGLSNCTNQSGATLAHGYFYIWDDPNIPGDDSARNDYQCAHSQQLGSMAYFRSAFTVNNTYVTRVGRGIDCIIYKDIVLYNEGTAHPTLKPIHVQKYDGGHHLNGNTHTDIVLDCHYCDRSYINATQVGFQAASVYTTAAAGAEGGAVLTNIRPTLTTSYADAQAAKAAGANPFQNDAGPSQIGARMCKRYVNGTLTQQNLWPWPMDSQLKNALDFAEDRGDHPFDSTYYFGPTGTVTGLMESIWGPIPAGCKG